MMEAIELRNVRATAPPNPRLRRVEASAYLLEQHGLSFTPGSLSTLAVKGGGPSFQKAGRTVLYPVAELDRWADQKLGPVVRNTTEARAAVR